MSGARNIKPGFFMNETLAELSWQTRLLFIGLWTLADREGRLEDRPRRIRGQLFPYDADIDVEEGLVQLAERGFIKRYEVNGLHCIWIKNFTRHQSPHQNEKQSILPAYSDAKNANTSKKITHVTIPDVFSKPVDSADKNVCYNNELTKFGTITCNVPTDVDTCHPDSLDPDCLDPDYYCSERQARPEQQVRTCVDEKKSQHPAKNHQAVKSNSGNFSSVLAEDISPPENVNAGKLKNSQANKSTSSLSVVITFPLNDGSEFVVDQALFDEWVSLYPAVDVSQALRNCRGWDLSHPNRRKTRQGIKAHINHWLAKEQNKAGTKQDGGFSKPINGTDVFAGVI